LTDGFFLLCSGADDALSGRLCADICAPIVGQRVFSEVHKPAVLGPGHKAIVPRLVGKIARESVL
jgi:hypothetical protein